MSPGPPPVPGGGRSDDERERARLSRESRRDRPSTAAGRAAASRQIPRPSSGSRRVPPRDPRVAKAVERDRARREELGERPPRAPRQGNYRLRRLFLLAGAVVLIAVAWFLVSLYQPFGNDQGEKKTVTIKANSSVGDIGSTLADQDIVSSGFFFELRATLSGKRGALKPGTYTLPEGLSYSDAIALLEKGPPPNTINVAIPEGRSRSEIADSIGESGLRGNYEKASRRASGFDPGDYGARKARDLEGFLWPATYELKRGQSVDALVDKQLAEFRKEFALVPMQRAEAKNLTPYEVLTIASLVERETAVPSERKLIAGVIYNRLAQDQSLGIDATVRFIYSKWDGALTQSELNSNSPYNTRKFKGLPPGPIGNPGLASLKAAAAPADTDFLFYVSNPCKPGTHTFHETLAEFNAAAARYNQAREAAGGRAPKGC